MRITSSESLPGSPESSSGSYTYQVPRAVSASSTSATESIGKIRLKIKVSLLPKATQGTGKTEKG